MEFPVDYIDRPRLYGKTVTFLVHWEDGSVTEEEVSNLIPGSVQLVEQYLFEFGDPYINTVLILWADQTTSYEPISFCTNCDEALLSYLDFLLRIGGHEDEIEKILWYLERKSSIKNT